MVTKIFIVLMFLVVQGCSGTLIIEKNGYTHQIDHRHLNPVAAYGFSHSYDKDGILVDTNLVRGKSLGEVGLNAAGAVGLGIGAYKGLKAIETATDVVVDVVLPGQ